MDTDYRMIVSRASYDNKALVITAGGGTDDKVYVQLQVSGADPQFDLQLWERRAVRDGKGYILVNKERGKCLARASVHNGSALILVGTDQIQTNDLLVWRDDSVPGTYNAINSYVDWEQKINIPGDGPYKPGQSLITWEWSRGKSNELWLQLPYLKSVELLKIDFDVDAGQILDRTPEVVATQTVTNETAVEQDHSVTFTYSTSHRYNFKYEKGHKVQGSIEFSAGLPIIGKSKIKVMAEGHWKFSEENETSTQEQFEVHVPVKVPPYSSIQVTAVLLSGELDVPYTALLRMTYWNDEVVQKTSLGRFIGVNSYNIVTRYDPLGTPGVALALHPLPALVSAAA